MTPHTDSPTMGLIKDLLNALEAGSVEGVGGPSSLPKSYHQAGPVLGLEKEGWELLAHIVQGQVAFQVIRWDGKAASAVGREQGTSPTASTCW